MSVDGTSLWSEIRAGALSFSEPMPNADHLAFVTLVQLDGDICLSIDSRALALEPNALQELLDGHIERVRAELTERLAAVRSRIRWGSAGFGALPTIVSATYVNWRDDSVARWIELIPDLTSGLVATALDYGLVVGLGLATSFVARLVLRRQFRKFVRPALTPEEAEHQREKVAMTRVSDPS